MLIAYVAYKNLTSKTRSRVNTLLKLNPLYSKWTSTVPSKQKGLVAFVKAATWPDCIKQASCDPGYTSDGGNTPPGAATDSQNIGYSDKLMHKYWHFIDVPDSAGAPGVEARTPNAQTEIELLMKAINTKESPNIKSYDIAWLEHLVGDIHQPLHATSRFTKNHPGGDAGGNLIFFCARPCSDELHAYWDGLLGDTPTIAQVTAAGDALLAAPRPSGADNPTPGDWVQDSFQLARSSVYVAPISDDNDPSVTLSARPDAAYAAQALTTAQSQATLAGYRLASLLNNHLK